MTLSQNDFDSLEKLIRLAVSDANEQLATHVDVRIDEISRQIDGLYKRDELREQEYLVIRKQVARLEQNPTRNK